MRVEAEARSALEQRYYGGQAVLFPDAATIWEAHVEQVGRLTRIADAISLTKEVHPADRPPVAIEIDPHYAQVALERWQVFTGQMAVRLDGTPANQS